MAYKGSTKPLPEISRELGVDLVLEGSIVRDEKRVRVTAQPDRRRHRRTSLGPQLRSRRSRRALAAGGSRDRDREEVNVTVAPRLELRFAKRKPMDPRSSTRISKA
jgi:hypothetical protein